MTIVRIPKPCHESWSKMFPTEQGKFCLSCEKEVVDFSDKSAEEVVNFFQSRTNPEERVCGRFNVQDLEAPVRKAGFNYKFINWGLGVLVGFLQSCGWGKSQTTGEIIASDNFVKIDRTQTNTSSILGKVAPKLRDTSSKYVDTQVMGNIITPQQKSIDSVNVESAIEKIKGEVMMGDVKEIDCKKRVNHLTGLVVPDIEQKVIMGDTTLPIKTNIKK